MVKDVAFQRKDNPFLFIYILLYYILITFYYYSILLILLLVLLYYNIYYLLLYIKKIYVFCYFFSKLFGSFIFSFYLCTQKQEK